MSLFFLCPLPGHMEGMNSFPQFTEVQFSEMPTFTQFQLSTNQHSSDWVQIQAPPLTSHVTLDKLASLCLIFLVCKVGYLCSPTFNALKMFLSHNSKH